MDSLRDVLKSLQCGEISLEQAEMMLKKQPFEDLDFAKVDLHRKMLQGQCEVIYGAGKTTQQIVGIVQAMQKNAQPRVLITRISKETAVELKEHIDIEYFESARLGIVGGKLPVQEGRGKIVVATGGTSDMPVAEEAALVAEFYGNEVVRLYDVGVAGLHRLLSHMDSILTADVIIAIAGMEGALASVIAGMASCPVIAVPTSIGYGASFNGLAALLSMLNSCASGVVTVNIDNGFGAAYFANMINSKGGKQ